MIQWWDSSTRRLQAEYDEHISDGLMMRILLVMVPPNITESLMAKLPDKNAKDENGEGTCEVHHEKNLGAVHRSEN